MLLFLLILTFKNLYDQSVKISHNANWSYIPDHPYRILNICGSGSEKKLMRY